MTKIQLLYRLLLCVFSMAVFASSTHAQMGNNWCFGRKAGITFNTLPASTFTSAIHDRDSDTSGARFSQCYSNCKGELLLYTGDGYRIWNKKHKLLPSCSIVAPTTYNSLFLPDPNDDSTIFLFVNGVDTSVSHFEYYTIDLRLDSGRGDISSGPTLISDSTSNVIAYIKHANDTSYWVLVKNNFFTVNAYLLSTAGLSKKPIVTKMIGKGWGNANSPSVNFRVSNTGKYIIAPQQSSIGKVINFIYDFDNATGKFSNARTLVDNQKFYFESSVYVAFSFSPNDSIVYAITTNTGADSTLVYQIPTHDPNPYLKIKLVNGGITNDGNKGPQLGPDNRIYLLRGRDSTRSGRYLSYIPYPDVWGSGSGLIINGIKVDSGTNCKTGDMPCYAFPVKRIANKFDVTGANGCGYDSVRFTADADSAFKSYNWYFGDGDSATGKSVVHQYKNPGSYYVKLGCELGNCGYMQWVGDSVTIKFKPTVSLNTNQTIYCGEQTIDAQVNYRYSDTVQVAWGDGTDTLLYVADTNLADSVQLQHIYNKTGNYAISCKAWNPNCYDSVATVYNIIIDTLPKSSFAADYITSCGTKSIILTDTSKFDSVVVNRTWHIYKVNGFDTTITTGAVNNLSFLFNDTGAYSVKLTVQSKQGCIDSLEKINYIQINPFPASKISGKTSWCGVDSTTLSVMGGNNYKWSTGDTTALVLLKPLTSNYYSVVVTNIYNCSAKDSVYITVGKILKPNFKPDYIQSCGYSTITLADSSGGMDSIIQQRKWMIEFPNNAIKQYDTVSSNKLKLIVQDTGYYNTKLIYVTKQGCTDSLTKTNVFRILPQPVVYIDSPSHNPLCFGDSFVLTAKQKDINYPPLVKYKWNAGPVNTPSIIVDSSNSYYVSATNSYGCGSQSNTVKISFLPQLFTNIKTAKDSLYTISTRPILSYTWYKDTIFYSNTSSLFHPPTGRYYVHVVDGNGCVANSGSLLHIGLNNITYTDNGMYIYPNPANDKLYISTENLKTIYIYNLLGELVYQSNFVLSKPIDISALGKGLYLLKAENTFGEKHVIKFVKE